MKTISVMCGRTLKQETPVIAILVLESLGYKIKYDLSGEPKKNTFLIDKFRGTISGKKALKEFFLREYKVKGEEDPNMVFDLIYKHNKAAFETLARFVKITRKSYDVRIPEKDQFIKCTERLSKTMEMYKDFGYMYVVDLCRIVNDSKFRVGRYFLYPTGIKLLRDYVENLSPCTTKREDYLDLVAKLEKWYEVFK